MDNEENQVYNLLIYNSEGDDVLRHNKDDLKKT